jgi:phage N-6-adenine-methyltransferase
MNLTAANDNAMAFRTTANTGNDEWYTPARYIELARTVMGAIDLDPASNDHAQKTVRASAYYTEETNGLDKPWHGRVWCNPPYSKKLMPAFAEKIVTEVAGGRVEQAVVLVNNCTDTRWFDDLARASSAICLTVGRIKFMSPLRDTRSPAQGQAFFYFGRGADRFAAAFREVGNVFALYRDAERAVLAA